VTTIRNDAAVQAYNLEGLRPLARDSDIVVFGYRDHAEQQTPGNRDIHDTSIRAFDITQARTPTFSAAVQTAVAHIDRPDLDGIWIHLDADALDDAIMPAVDYRIPGGLAWDEVSALLRTVIATGKVVGLTVTIFNPLLDTDGSIAARFADCIVQGDQPGIGYAASAAARSPA